MAKKLSALQKQRRRVQQYIRRGEQQKGLRWTDEFKESLKSKSTRALKNMTPEKLLKQATGISPKTGKVVSGIEVQKERRSLSAQRGWETRRQRTTKQEIPYADDIILQQIEQLADAFDNAASRALKSLLSSEITKYGRTAVVKALANSPEEALADAQAMIYYEGKRDTMIRAYDRLASLIRGYIANEDEARETGDIMDMMEDGEPDLED